MGKTEDSEHRSLMTVKDPLIFIYKSNTSLNASTLEFQSFDIFTNPREIKARIVTMYPASEDQARLYEEHHGKIFKEVNHGKV